MGTAALPVPGWYLLTRLGEAQILLPVMLATAAWLGWRERTWALARRWLTATAAAALLTTATKVAFIGWGVGSATLDFTGISGHAMFAAAILPVLLRLCEAPLPPRLHGLGLAAGCALALAVAVSRGVLNAHSPSEIVSGSLLGFLASAATLQRDDAPRPRLPLALPLVLCLALTLGVAAAPPSRTHDWVTRLALAASGHAAPYTRYQMLRAARLRARPAAASQPAR